MATADANAGVPSSQPSNPKPRPIVRIGTFLISHSALFSLICCAAGILALFLLPVLAKNTYVSENALMPGSANPMFSNHDTMEANRLVKDIMDLKLSSGIAGIEISNLLGKYMRERDADVYHHNFHVQKNQFHLGNFFSDSSYSWHMKENRSCSQYGINTVAIIRAPRGDGKEAIVLVSPYNSTNIRLSDALSLGLSYSIFSLLSRVNWLAKDIIWLAADSQYGEYASVAAWLKDYHNPSFLDSDKSDDCTCPESNALLSSKGQPNTGGSRFNVFRHAGTLAAALVFKVVDGKEETKDTLSIYAEASNGQMPNLDLINIVNYLAVHRQGLHVKVAKLYSVLNSAWLRTVGQIFEFIGKTAKIVNPQWGFGISAADYVEGTATLASSIYYQALGIPTGSHGAFRDYQIDAITLEMSPRFSLYNEVRRLDFLLRGGRLLEGVIRSVNNLLEKFHQSFFLYLLSAPSKFVSVGIYMIAFMLLIIPLPMVAASLYSGPNKRESSARTNNENPDTAAAIVTSSGSKSWKWLHAAKVVFVVHLWAGLVSLIPYLINQLPERTPTACMLVWVLLSFVSLIILYWIAGSPYSYKISHQSPNMEWAILKAVMISVASIGLGLMSIINYATAQIGAIFMVPMCLLAHPLKHAGNAGKLRVLSLTTSNMVLAVIGFPPAALLLVKGWLEGFDGVSFGDFWIWAETLWTWNSATYLYLVLIQLPCWVLCMHILLHP
ncbi:hypothetical protein Scep_021206 [Stephania cephalantha]|uniref:Glycosylphosphatidylinositol anchor attachment 1 protein n=1 Tax=Stephania cephalantha TaxID=152367 RepID=A0AAP0F5P4_9MAGN